MITKPQPEFWPATRELLDAFSDEITKAGGTVSDTHDDGRLLIARAVLPADNEIQLGDKVNAGVAIRAAGNEVVVHPYTFRQVCSNGAIVVKALDSCRFERIESEFVSYEATVALGGVREATRACASSEAFATAAADMRLASETPGEWAIVLLHHFAGWGERHAMVEMLTTVLERFRADSDRSAFGLMNAVTSLARDTRDPETRWKLETIGGELPALVRQYSPRPRTRAAKLELETVSSSR